MMPQEGDVKYNDMVHQTSTWCQRVAQLMDARVQYREATVITTENLFLCHLQ